MPDRDTRRSLTRRSFLRLAGGASAGAALLAGCQAKPRYGTRLGDAPPPNIVFILADDLGYGDLGCYGQQQIRTPHLDRLATEGIRFTQAYAGSTVCAPSRCALMTGLHTGHCYVRGNKRVPLRPEDVTVGEVLREAGYVTGIVGKWGLGEPGTTGIPTRQGFDSWFGYLNQHHAHNYWPTHLWRNEQRVPLKNVVPEETSQGGGVATERVEYSHDLFTAEALAFVEKHRDRPFFLYLAYTLPHANNEAGETGMEIPSDEPYTDRPWPQQQKNHAAMISRLDRDVGRLLALVARLGLDERTVVFFASDNGPHREGGADPNFFDSNGPLRGIKRALYDGGIRVPAMVRWPGRIRPGAISDHVWAFWDFLPTAADLAGAAVPEGLDGLSIAPTLLGGEQPQHDHLYWEFHERGFHQAVRMGDVKAVRREGKKTEIYDLADDLGETTDLAADRPDLVGRAEHLFRTARTDSKEFPIEHLPKKPPKPNKPRVIQAKPVPEA